ncbi:MAG TPA: OmpA family protein [Gammaproteobacteria bacterium]
MTLDQLTADVDEEGLDSFYISFGDLMVILCVFLVMLLTMSKIDIGSFEKIKSVMTGTTENTLVELSGSLKEIIEGTPGIPGAEVQLAKDGVRVDLDTGVLFATGSAVIKDEALASIAPLFNVIIKTDYLIDIEGHTDDVPLYKVVDGEVESNWSLSGKRASSVILHLRSLGFSSRRLRVVGYAYTRPVVDISGLSGVELDEARARNRRVSLLIR